jgi:CBS domain containing-hemolysin-like protein
MLELIIFFLFAVVVSFICSLSEAGLLSLRRPDIVRLKDSGHWSGSMLAKLTADKDRPLAAILTINTLANCFGAAGVGSAAAKIWGPSGMAGASAVLTMCILVFSEIIPKTLGASYAARLSSFIAIAVRGMLILTYPVVIVMRQISRLISRGPQKSTREDVSLAAKIGLEDGVLDEGEAFVISNVVKLTRSSVADYMTPRVDVVALAGDATVGEVTHDDKLLTHGRFPIYGDNPQQVIGVVQRDNILRRYLEGEKDLTLADIARKPAPYVHENKTVRQAVEEMYRKRAKQLVVVGDDGSFKGILTEHCIDVAIFGSSYSGD